MRWWQEATLQHPDRVRVKGEEETTQWNDTLFTHLKRLRTTSRHLFTASIERHSANASDLEEFNRVLALGHQSLEMDATGETIALYETTEPEYGAVLVPIAQSALYIFIEAERVRLRKCANERCIALFYDTTRSATRHWCSPECMNRARSLQHYREAKARKTSSTPH
jgi:predicted RNA-binding Zn ribbon-like protein